MTTAPASRARAPVASVDPSSTTMISRHAAASLSCRTTVAIDSSSSCAGITIETTDGSATRVFASFATLRRKTDVDDIAVLDDVFLAFEPHFAVFAADRHRPARRQRVVGDDFGTDESSLD